MNNINEIKETIRIFDRSKYYINAEIFQILFDNSHVLKNVGFLGFHPNGCNISTSYEVMP